MPETISCHIQETMSLRAREKEGEARRLCKTLKRLPQGSLVDNWSCDWEQWKQMDAFLIAPEFYDLSRMDMTMKCLYRLQTPVCPIAYRKDTNDHAYTFKAGAKYYYWLPDFEVLMQLDGIFTDENVLRGWDSLVSMFTAELDLDYDGIEEKRELEMVQRELARQARI